MRFRSLIVLFFSSSPVVAAQTQPVPPPVPPPGAVVLAEPMAAAWLTVAGIPAQTVSEAQLIAALGNAALVVLPLQEVRRADTVDALKAYVAKGGRIIAVYWGPPGVKTPVTAPLSTLLGINVTGWSGRGNNLIAAVGAGKPLFNGSGRLRLGRGYTVIATMAPSPPLALAPSPTPPLAPSPPPPFIAGRWVKQDGRSLRANDAAVIQTSSTLWIAENPFADANDSLEVRRWFANAAVTIAPALRLFAKQALLTAAQTRLNAARAALSAARAQGMDAPFNDAQTSLDAASTALASAGREMDFTAVLATLDTFKAALSDAAAQSTPSRSVEVRAVWIEQTALTKSRDDVRRLVGRLADAHFNVILPEIVYRGKAAFPSTVYVQDSRLAGFDPLRVLIEEAHKRGMEVHPWVWTLCAGYYGEQGPLLRSNPEWAARDKAGRTMSEGNRLFWLSPAIPAVRTAIRNVIREIAARYDVDGIHLDYARYHSPYYDYSDDACSAFATATGDNPLTLSSISTEYVKWHLWREQQVNTLVRDIHDDLISIKPFAKLSAAVYQTPDDARRDRLQDWGFWLKNRWVDWVAPMTYTAEGAELGRWIAADASVADGLSYLVPGLNSDALQDPSALAAQVAACRTSPAQGVALFAAAGLSDDMLRSLRLGAFRAVAAVPWKDPRKAAATLAASAATMFSALAAPDENAATAGRAATAAVSTWAVGTLDQLAVAAPIANTSALADPRYNEPRAILEDARRIAAAALKTPPDAGLAPMPPPIVTVANPLPLPSLSVPQTTAIVNIDGKLDEPAWKVAEDANLNRNTEGANAKVGATARIMRDASTLYIGITCPEPNMAALQAVVTERDGRVYDDDSVEVFLAPNEIGLPYYHFVVGAGGAGWDDRSGDKAWNGRWTWAVSKDATSWTAEIAVPFSALNAAPLGKWRANLARNRRPDGPSFINWSTTYGSYHTPDRFGTWAF